MRRESDGPPSWIGDALRGPPVDPMRPVLTVDAGLAREFHNCKVLMQGRMGKEAEAAWLARLRESDIPREDLVAALKRLPEEADFMKMKSLVALAQRIGVEKDSKMRSRGFHRMGLGSQIGTLPHVFTVGPGEQVYRRVEEYGDSISAVQEDGSMKQIGTYQADELGWWFYIPNGKTPEDHPRWNKSAKSKSETQLETAKKFPPTHKMGLRS